MKRDCVIVVINSDVIKMFGMFPIVIKLGPKLSEKEIYWLQVLQFVLMKREILLRIAFIPKKDDMPHIVYYNKIKNFVWWKTKNINFSHIKDFIIFVIFFL